MVVAASTCSSADSLREILQVGELTTPGSAGEVCRQLGELTCRAGVALRLGRLSGALQVRGNLLSHLLVFRWVRFLKLLQGVRQLRRGREPAAVGLGCSSRAGVARGICRDSRALQSTGQHLLQIRAGNVAYGTGTHESLIGTFSANFRVSSTTFVGNLAVLMRTIDRYIF